MVVARSFFVAMVICEGYSTKQRRQTNKIKKKKKQKPRRRRKKRKSAKEEGDPFFLRNLFGARTLRATFQMVNNTGYKLLLAVRSSEGKVALCAEICAPSLHMRTLNLDFFRTLLG